MKSRRIIEFKIDDFTTVYPRTFDMCIEQRWSGSDQSAGVEIVYLDYAQLQQIVDFVNKVVKNDKNE